MGWHLTISLETDPAALRIVRRFVYAALKTMRTSEMDARAVEVSVAESLNNARLHAYNGGHGPVRVEIRWEEQAVEITVRDRGESGAVPAIRATLPTDPSGGRGLYLVGQLMDRVQIVHPDSAGRGTAVRMLKNVAARFGEQWSERRPRRTVYRSSHKSAASEHSSNAKHTQ